MGITRDLLSVITEDLTVFVAHGGAGNVDVTK
jgi:hypothetical protein